MLIGAYVLKPACKRQQPQQTTTTHARTYFWSVVKNVYVFLTSRFLFLHTSVLFIRLLTQNKQTDYRRISNEFDDTQLEGL